MSVVHLRHVQVSLKRMFDGKIDLSDYNGKPAVERETAFLTRALAAYTIHHFAGVDEDTAAGALIDGFNDNGIDAIYFAEPTNTLWIVQTKWIHSGQGCPGSAEVKKFTDGIRDLINYRWNRFNDRLRWKLSDITKALEDAKTQIGIVLAYPGGPLSTHPARDLADLVTELNNPTELAEAVPFSLAEIHRAVAGLTQDADINFDLSLLEWGMKREPRKAFYGQANAADLARLWEQYGQRLANQNIRRFLGDNSVNEDIQTTLKVRPDDFWYFNNGITILCTSVDKKPMGGNNRDFGVFECKGAHIVNGAQTVGNLGRVFGGAQTQVEKAKVFVRLISLENCPEGYASELTRATNTQNKIEKRDFVSLDPQQERLRAELHIEGVRYVYKTGDAPVSSDEGCTLEETTASLACSSHELQYAIWSKKEVGKLWEDISLPPYSNLFNAQLNGTKLWRLVQILRIVDRSLKAGNREGTERNIAVHGNRFVAYLVFNNLRMSDIDNPAVSLNSVLEQSAVLTDRVLAELCSAVDTVFPEAMISRLFYNLTKCWTLAHLVQGQLTLTRFAEEAETPGA